MCATVTPIMAVDSTRSGCRKASRYCAATRCPSCGQVAQLQPVGGDEGHLGGREEHGGEQADEGQPDEHQAAASPGAGLRRVTSTSTTRVRSTFSTVTTKSGVSRRSALRGTRPKRSSTQPPTVS